MTEKPVGTHPTIVLLKAILAENKKQTKHLRSINISTSVIALFYLILMLGLCVVLTFGASGLAALFGA